MCPWSVIELPRNEAALFLSPSKNVKSTAKHLFQQEAITQHFLWKAINRCIDLKSLGIFTDVKLLHYIPGRKIKNLKMDVILDH